MTLISVILPTYNERGNVIDLISQILMFKDSQYEIEIIVVDDSSPDGTANSIRSKFRNNHNVIVIEREESDGLAGAILTGIRASKGEILVGMDADGNHDPKILPELVNKLSESDLVIASRFISEGGMDNMKRYALTKMFNYLIRILFGFPTTDNMSGYYAIRRSLLNKLPLQRIYKGYGDYHLRLVWAMKILRGKFFEIPVYYHEREYGKSKSRLIKMFLIYIFECVRLSKVKTLNEI